MLEWESASLRYHVYQFLDKMDNFEFLGQNLPKNGFWSRNFKNLSLDSESGSLRYYVRQFSDKTDNIEFLGPNLAHKWFWGTKFDNSKSGFGINTSKIPWCQFSVKIDNFQFFGLNVGKLPNYVQYFGSTIVEGVAKSWGEVDGAGWRLKWDG